MIFDGKPATEISVTDLEALIGGGIQEDQFLDFKARPYPQTPEGTRELLKDVTAFANADGGYLIIGIAEDGERRANAFAGVDDPERVRRSMIPKQCKRLAEVDLPIAVVSAHSGREKSIRHGHPSALQLWWARRSLAAFLNGRAGSSKRKRTSCG